MLENFTWTFQKCNFLWNKSLKFHMNQKFSKLKSWLRFPKTSYLKGNAKLLISLDEYFGSSAIGKTSCKILQIIWIHEPLKKLAARFPKITVQFLIASNWLKCRISKDPHSSPVTFSKEKTNANIAETSSTVSCSMTQLKFKIDTEHKVFATNLHFQNRWEMKWNWT